MTDENHVLLKVLQNDVMHLTATVEMMRGDFRKWRSDQERRITLLETDQARIETQLDHQRRRGALADVGAFATAIIAAIVGTFAKQP